MLQPSSFCSSVLASCPSWGQVLSAHHWPRRMVAALTWQLLNLLPLGPGKPECSSCLGGCSRTSLVLRFAVRTKTHPEPSSLFWGTKIPRFLQPEPHGSDLSALNFHSQAAAGTSRGTSPSWDFISELKQCPRCCLPFLCFYAMQIQNSLPAAVPRECWC